MQIDFLQLDEYFAQAAGKLSPEEVKKLLEDELSPAFIEAWYRRFNTQTNADGSPWSSDLVDTGELRDSISVDVVDTSIIAGPTGARNEDLADVLALRGNMVGGIDEELDSRIALALDNLMYEALS